MPVARHRRQPIERSRGRPQMGRGEVRIPQGHSIVRMSENFFHFLQAAPTHDHVKGRCMTEIVKAVVQEAGALDRILKSRSYLASA